jgi:hypothetical protein
MLARKQIENPTEVEDACSVAGVELETDYPAVLAKLTRSMQRAERPKRAKKGAKT